MGLSQWEANLTMLHKGNTGYLKDVRGRAHSGLESNTQFLSVGRVHFSGSKASAPLRSWPQAITGSAKPIPNFR